MRGVFYALADASRRQARVDVSSMVIPSHTSWQNLHSSRACIANLLQASVRVSPNWAEGATSTVSGERYSPPSRPHKEAWGAFDNVPAIAGNHVGQATHLERRTFEGGRSCRNKFVQLPRAPV